MAPSAKLLRENKMNRARQLFNEIIGGASSRIERMVADAVRESEYLDFKGTGGGRCGESKIIKIWSKCLSGFANTEGGVLIWGIDARPTDVGESRKIDIASGFDLINEPNSHAQLLLDTLLDSVVDPLRGVEVEPFESTTDAPKGYVVCYVPEGPGQPYRAARDNIYYQRVSDSFVPINHHLLRRMFYPHTSATFAVIARKKDDRQYDILIENRGTATAENVSIRVLDYVSNNKKAPQFKPLSEWSNIGEQHYQFARHRVHPRMQERLGLAAATDFSLSLTIFWQDAQPETFSLAVSTENIMADSTPEVDLVFGPKNDELD